MPQSKHREQVLDEHTTEIICQIASLLPERYRGFYSEHPRLKELVADA
jgi:1-acyl-sn-glycerol-3-phosphate acyltransferase